MFGWQFSLSLLLLYSKESNHNLYEIRNKDTRTQVDVAFRMVVNVQVRLQVAVREVVHHLLSLAVIDRVSTIVVILDVIFSVISTHRHGLVERLAHPPFGLS